MTPFLFLNLAASQTPAAAEVVVKSPALTRQEISFYIMHHVQDHVVYPLHIFNFDISITHHVLMMWISTAILILFLPAIVKSRSIKPKGAVNFIEWIVAFLIEKVIKPQLGRETYRFAPYLLTAFFFILTCNLLGLVPTASVATGNISVTAAMALMTFGLVQYSGIRRKGLLGYMGHFVPQGVPAVIRPFMFVVELLGMFTKHFALALRLFANELAGHLVIFTILIFIFIFKSFSFSMFPILGVIFIELLEVMIALIQAYIFTILSAVFIGMAIHPSH